MGKLLTIIDGPRMISCSFATRQIKKIGNKTIGIKLSSSSTIGVDDKKGSAKIGWSVRSDSAGVPFTFDVEVEALFKMAKKLTKKEIFEAAKMDAGPLLIVVIRDIVSDLTRKAELPPFYMSYPDFASLKGVEKKNGGVSKRKTKSIE